MQPTGSESSPAPAIPERFAAFLAAPLPNPESMSSTDRIAWITTLRDIISSKIVVPENILKTGITLITMDRAEAAKAARSASASARKVSKTSAAEVASKIAGMSDEDAADAL